MEADERACPECAETIKTAAKVCRHCGYRLDQAPPPPIAPPPQPPTPPSSKPAAEPMTTGSKFAIGCVGLLIFFIIIGMIAGGGKKKAGSAASSSASAEASTDDSASSSAPAPARAVTAAELADAYEANEQRAQKEYGDQRLAVTGIVDGVALDMFDAPVVHLASGKFLPVQASFSKDFADQTSSLDKGNAVTVTCGKVSEIMGTPMLDDCDGIITK
jgi:hypothetical protein